MKKMKNVASYRKGLPGAISKVRNLCQDSKYQHPLTPPMVLPGVVPAGRDAPVMAMDSPIYGGGFACGDFVGFPGFPYLSQLATRAEYRAFANAIATELTREWIDITSTQSDGVGSGDRIKAIEAEFKRLDVRGVIRKAAEMDVFFGRGQVFIDIEGADRDKPLILDPRTIRKGSFVGVKSIEAIWTTPSSYNADDPSAPNFYVPVKWFMLGQEVHASRLLTIITRELPDILKPAFNFAGMSLSQLAEPYVDNWLRTRQSVSNLISNFSTTALKTSMSQTLQGDDEGQSLVDRAKLFTLLRSNQGLMLMDKETEEMVQLNVPLSGLHELQAQSQEHLCSVSRLPAIVLTGISPSGLNASSDGEIRIFYDWIAAQQEAYWRSPLEIILKVVQLSLFGDIDPEICLSFKPLYQMTPAEESDIRLKNSQAATAYIGSGVLAPEEERARLADDPTSGYQGLDVEDVPLLPGGNLETDEFSADEDDLDDVGGEDKSVSAAQHRAMEAAAHGHSTLGIPEKVGKEFVSKDCAQDANLIEADPNDTLPEVLRKAIAAEIDAVNLYERMSASAKDEDAQKVLLSVAAEEKSHIGEFQALLLKVDPEQATELVKGAKEVKGNSHAEE